MARKDKDFGLNRPIQGVAMIFATLTCLTATSASASSKPVTDAHSAIVLANKACNSSWGSYSRQQGHSWHAELSEWRARLTGKTWIAWTGDEANPDLVVHVAKSGNSVSDCDLRFKNQ